MDYALILSTCVVSVLAIRRRLFMPFPLGFIVLLLLSQIAFKLAHDGLLWNSFYALVDYGGLTRQYLHTQVLYSAMAILSYAVMQPAAERFDMRAVLSEIKSVSGGDRFATTTLVLFCIVAAHFLLFVYAADWQKIWFHRSYLIPIVDESFVAMWGPEIPTTIVKTAVFTYIVSIFGFYLAMKGRSAALKVGFFLFATFYFLMFLALHSRVSTAYPFFMALFYMLSAQRGKIIVLPLLAIGCMFTLTCALLGRSSGAHGFSALGWTSGLVLHQPILESLRVILLNITEGIFEIAEAIQVDASFASKYRLLSLSPLPSFIDGFNDILWVDQVRLNKFVPMPGVGEAYHFGVAYSAAILGILGTAIVAHLKIARRSGPAFLLCNMLIFLACYHLLAYPVRNALHFAWISLAVSGAILMAAREVPERGAVPGRGPARGRSGTALIRGRRSRLSVYR